MGNEKIIIKAAVIIAAGLVLSSVIDVVGNRYSMIDSSIDVMQRAYRIDALTGEVAECRFSRCEAVSTP